MIQAKNRNDRFQQGLTRVAALVVDYSNKVLNQLLEGLRITASWPLLRQHLFRFQP